jgi:hypothetical protein
MTALDLFIFLNDLNLNEDEEVLENMEIELAYDVGIIHKVNSFVMTDNKKSLILF